VQLHKRSRAEAQRFARNALLRRLMRRWLVHVTSQPHGRKLKV
jgi:hypothetical protein